MEIIENAVIIRCAYFGSRKNLTFLPTVLQLKPDFNI